MKISNKKTLNITAIPTHLLKPTVLNGHMLHFQVLKTLYTCITHLIEST